MDGLAHSATLHLRSLAALPIEKPGDALRQRSAVHLLDNPLSAAIVSDAQVDGVVMHGRATGDEVAPRVAHATNPSSKSVATFGAAASIRVRAMLK